MKNELQSLCDSSCCSDFLSTLATYAFLVGVRKLKGNVVALPPRQKNCPIRLLNPCDIHSNNHFGKIQNCGHFVVSRWCFSCFARLSKVFLFFFEK